jgi:two-component system cell cycle sensor histidine kinase/response regulator CckA
VGPRSVGPRPPQGRESECWQLRKGGERFFATVVTTSMRNADGTLRGHAKVVRDVTKRRELEEQLRSVQKMEAIGRLAGGVAHDFNNLLLVIGAYTDLAAEELPVDSAALVDLDEVRKATGRATALTRQLLAFSRKQVLRPEVLDVNALLAGLQKVLARLLGEDVELLFSPAPRLGATKADVGQIEQVLLNLAINARDAMPSGGRLRIETRNAEIDAQLASRHVGLEPGSYVQIAVEDNGAGMDEATAARVFEPFFSTKPAGKGTGLGLAMAYGIVNQSGGQIQVESAPGRGTTFRIQLPAVASESVAVSPSEHPPAVRGRERLLLVEDEDLVRRSLVRALTRHGYDVLEASGAGAALDELQHAESRIDLMVTDVVMPGMSGPKLVEVVRRILPDLRVLYISGYTDDLVTLGADDTHAFLQKPFSPASLLEKVRAVLDTPLT